MHNILFRCISVHKVLNQAKGKSRWSIKCGIFPASSSTFDKSGEKNYANYRMHGLCTYINTLGTKNRFNPTLVWVFSLLCPLITKPVNDKKKKKILLLVMAAIAAVTDDKENMMLKVFWHNAFIN